MHKNLLFLRNVSCIALGIAAFSLSGCGGDVQGRGGLDSLKSDATSNLGDAPGSVSKAAGSTASTVSFSPYKDALVNMDWNTSVISTQISGNIVSFADDLKKHGVSKAFIGFATGECGNESWGGVPGADIAAANVKLFAAQGISYVLSTGGAAGAFTCASDAGMKTFVERWKSARLAGIDFDIEAGQSPQDIDNLVQRVPALRQAYPTLRYTLTLATLAANQGASKATSLGPAAPDSLNAYGDEALQSVKKFLGWKGTETSWPKDVNVNLMAMDYGTASPGVCVVAGGHCDMGQSTLQAAMNLHDHWHVPYANIEVTPMIGRNDVQDESFTLADATQVMSSAKTNGLAGVHFWSYDRDVDCPDQWASPTCNSMGAVYAGPYGYLNKFLGKKVSLSAR